MAKIAGEGTILKVDVSDTLTAIANVISVSGPDSSVPEVENTTLGANSKQYRAGKIPEAGTIDCSIYFDPADSGHQALLALAKTPQRSRGRSHGLMDQRSTGKVFSHPSRFRAWKTSLI
ncbi:MAG: hypothetical protein R3C12_18630 [Planctomycetaceae bacterium]